MGMFDYVKVGVPLPDGWEATELQSKDFACKMTTVEITPDGRLRIEEFEYENVPKEERPHPDKDGILGMMGSIRKVNRRWRDLNFHGVFNFYGQERIAPPANPPYFHPDEHKWHEYNAKFTDGQLVKIEVV